MSWRRVRPDYKPGPGDFIYRRFFRALGFAYQAIPRFKFTTLWQPLLVSRSDTPTIEWVFPFGIFSYNYRER